MNNYHSGRKLQLGRGIGSLFASITRSLLPMGKKILTSNTTKALAKSVGKTLKEAAVDTAIDVLEGKSPKEAAQRSLERTKRKIADKLKDQPKSHKTSKSKKAKISIKKRRPEGYYFLK